MQIIFKTDSFTHYSGFVATIKYYPKRAVKPQNVNCPSHTSDICTKNLELSGLNDWICLPNSLICDNLNHCGSNLDEDESLTCPLDLSTVVPIQRLLSQHDQNNQFACLFQNSQLVPISWRCDGFLDCIDGSDEANCPSKIDEQEINEPNLSDIFLHQSNKPVIFSGPALTYFSHANYPSKYKRAQKLEWRISLSSPNSFIRIYFIKFLLPDVRGCLADSLTILDGNTNTSSYEYVKYCRTPDLVPLYLTFETNNLIIRLKTDNGFQGQLLLAYKGFSDLSNGLFLVSKELSHNCYLNGISYRGVTNRTETGDICQEWDSSNPWIITSYPEKLTGAYLENNYCRYPEEDIAPPFSRPYCYNTNLTSNLYSARSFCSVEPCSNYYQICPVNFFQCMDGQCLPKELVCDGRYDCLFREDELECNWKFSESKQISENNENLKENPVRFLAEFQQEFDASVINGTASGVVSPGVYRLGSQTSVLGFHSIMIIRINPSNQQNSYRMVRILESTAKDVEMKIEGQNVKTYISESQADITIEFSTNLKAFEESQDIIFEYKELTNCIHKIPLDDNFNYINFQASSNSEKLCLWHLEPQTAVFDTKVFLENLRLSGSLRLDGRVHSCEFSFDAVTGEKLCDDHILNCQESVSLYYQELGANNDGILVFNDQIENYKVDHLCGKDLSNFQIDKHQLSSTLFKNSTTSTAYQFYLIYENFDDKRINYKDYDSNTVRQIRPKCCGFDCDAQFSCIEELCPEYNSTSEFYLFQESEIWTKNRNKRSVLINSSPVCESWSNWMSASKPSGITLAGLTVSGGEYETYDRLRQKYSFCSDENIVNIDCRIKSSKINWKYADQVGQVKLTCDHHIGFLCSNRAQKTKCLDYEVKVYCSCGAKNQTFDAGDSALMSRAFQYELSNSPKEITLQTQNRSIHHS